MVAVANRNLIADLFTPYRNCCLDNYQVVLPVIDSDDLFQLVYHHYSDYGLNWDTDENGYPCNVNYCEVPVIFREGISEPFIEVRLLAYPLPFDEVSHA